MDLGIKRQRVAVRTVSAEPGLVIVLWMFPLPCTGGTRGVERAVCDVYAERPRRPFFYPARHGKQLHVFWMPKNSMEVAERG